MYNNSTYINFLRYAKPMPAMYWLGALCGAIGAGTIIYQKVSYNHIDEVGTTVLVIMLIVGMLFVIMGTSRSSNFRMSMRNIRIRHRENELLYDFENAGRAFSDRVILGDSFIIGRGTGAVVPYSEIRRVYQYIHTYNGIEDKRILRAELTNGRKIDLCTLPHNGVGNEELNNVMNYMRAVNPRIQLGYNGGW